MAKGRTYKGRQSKGNENIPRRGIENTEDYRFLPEFLIVLDKEEFDNLDVTPSNIDKRLKTLILQKAKREFRINGIKCPKSVTIDSVRLCPCNKRVGTVHNPALGDFQGDPIHNAGGRPQGDPIRDPGGRPNGDINSYINLNNVIAQSGFIHQASCCCKDSGSNGPKPDKALQISVLDTAVDIPFVYQYIAQHYPTIDTSLFSIIDKTCQHSDLSTNTSHGTMVVISLLERLYNHKKKRKTPVCINLYNVARDFVPPKSKLPIQIITQADVLCSLLKAVDDGNMFLNMSFGFSYQVHLIEKVLLEILPKVKLITCSAGNDGHNLTDGQHVNYPSGFAREFDTDQIKEVTGTMIDRRNRIVPWFKNATALTNKIGRVSGLRNYKRCEDDAVLDDSSKSGGTSFSSPRFLGKLLR